MMARCGDCTWHMLNADKNWKLKNFRVSVIFRQKMTRTWNNQDINPALKIMASKSCPQETVSISCSNANASQFNFDKTAKITDLETIYMYSAFFVL